MQEAVRNLRRTLPLLELEQDELVGCGEGLQDIGRSPRVDGGRGGPRND